MLTDAFRFSTQLFLAMALPSLLAVVVLGVVSSFLENLLGMKDSGLRYGVRFIVVVGIVYLFAQTTASQIQGELTYLLSK